MIDYVSFILQPLDNAYKQSANLVIFVKVIFVIFDFENEKKVL